MTFPRFGDSRAKSGAAVPLGFSSAARLRHSPSYPPVLSRNLVRSESNLLEALRWLSSTGRNRSRRRYEQSEPTEPRTARRSGRAAPGRTRAKPLNDLRQFYPEATGAQGRSILFALP